MNFKLTKPIDSPHICTVLNTSKCLPFLMETHCILFHSSSEFLYVIYMVGPVERVNEKEIFFIY